MDYSNSMNIISRISMGSVVLGTEIEVTTTIFEHKITVPKKRLIKRMKTHIFGFYMYCTSNAPKRISGITIIRLE